MTTMCCATLIAQETMMATTELMRAACEICWPLQDQQKTQYRPLRMNWVVVTDENGNRRLQMGWDAKRDD
jgi:hypothetical protein